MSKWIKKYWWVLLIAFVAIVAPLVMNWIILQPQKFEVVGDGAYWLGGTVASFAMVFITWRTLVQNRKQLNELKRQWDEQNRPYIIADISIINQYVHSEYYSNNYYLSFKNEGNVLANDVWIKMDSQFVDGIGIEKYRKRLKEIQERSYRIKPKETKHFFLFESNHYGAIKNGDTKDYNEFDQFEKYLENNPMKISFGYNKKYNDEETIIITSAVYERTTTAQILDRIGRTLEKMRESQIKEKSE